VSAGSLARSELDLPLVVTQLMKGVVYQDTHPKAWRHLLQLQPQLRDHVAVMGLVVVVDEAEGYAFLRSRPDAPLAHDGQAEDGRSGPQRLVARRSLSFPVSLTLALLRKRLAEFDASDSGVRCVVSREEIVETLRVFLPPTSHEARMVDQVDTLIGKIVDLGFLRRLRDEPDRFEIRRILKAFVDAQWLSQFDQELDRYAASVGALQAAPEPGVPSSVADDGRWET
jgi:hypothetical protein